MNEVKVNTIVPYKGKFYQIVNERGCSKCAFCNDDDDDCNDIQNNVSQCSCQVRSDKTEIIFKELPKNKDDVSLNETVDFGGMKVKAVNRFTCSQCSFNTICKKNNKSTSDTHLVDINDYFGSCSIVDRDDKEDVVFKIVDNNLLYIPSTGGIEQGTSEASTNHNKADIFDNNTKTNIIGDKVTDVITPNITDGECNNIEIVAPKGYIIDEESSDLTRGIIKFKSNNMTFSDIIDKLTDANIKIEYCTDANSYLIDLIKLRNIANYYNSLRDKKFNFNNPYSVKYAIVYNNDIKSYDIAEIISINYGMPLFINKDDAKTVINNPNFKFILANIFHNH